MATNVFRKDIAKINAKLSKHIGSIGEDVHGVAFGGQAGFIDYETYDRANSLFRNRKVFYKDTDPATLDYGSYVGNNIVNGPDNFSPIIQKDTMALVDVQPYGGGKKRVILTYAYSGKTFIKTVHTNGATLGWQELMTRKMLFMGSVESSKGTTINFQNSVTGYLPLRLIIMGDTPSSNSFTEYINYSRGQASITRVNSFKESNGSVGLTSYELNISWKGDILTVTDSNSVSQKNGTSTEVTGEKWRITNIWIE